MRTVNRYAIVVAAAALLAAALACGPSGDVTPTPTEGQQVGDTSATPTLPPSATEPPDPGTPVPDVTSESGCTLNAAWVADVTVPDNTEFPPGAAFIKTWRVRNSGTCDWETGTKLVYVSGDPLGGPTDVPVGALAAGSSTDVSVNMVAPSAPGTYKSNWQMRDPLGTNFGSVIYAQIVVPAPATDTPVPTATTPPTTAPTTAPTPFGGGSGRIAYVSFRDGNAEIYVMGEDDSAPTRLTNNPEIDDWPDWSPDGTQIVFTRYSGGKPDIYVMRDDGAFQTNLTNNPAWDTGPDWSPDDTRIAFASDRVGGKLQVWVMKADGSGALQLTNTPEINSSPNWSPNGNQIAFESERDGQREIYVMNADGTGQTRLTFTGGNYGPVWSPNGNKIAFSSSDGIWVMKKDGTQLMQLTTNAGPLIFDAHPHWSPDERRILFDSKRSGNQDLYTIKSDGTDLDQLTTNTANDLNPTWH